MDAVQIHNKIISFLGEKGPSLPINIAKQLGITSLFISAFLSELVNQNLIKVSHLKVGGSPLYFLEGQQEKLENYYRYLHPREAEAYMLLKQYKLLKDNDQDPVTRVALRSIRDFSHGFKMGEEIYWRFFSASHEEINEILYGKKEEEIPNQNEIKNEEKKEELKEDKEKIKEKETQNKEEILIVKQERNSPKNEKKLAEKFDNPLVIKEDKIKKEKPRSDFVQKVINFLNSKGIKIIEEKEYKTKEYNCIVQIKSELGPVNFFTQAKDKKTINEDDLRKLLSTAQSIPLPAFIIYNGEIASKAKNYLDSYSSILKAKKIN